MTPPGALAVEHAQPSAHRDPAAWPATSRVTSRAREWRVAGVPLRVDVSCLLGGLLVAWTFAAALLPETNPGLTATAYWTAGVLGAVLVMVSLLLHELGHAVTARRRGLAIVRVSLSFIGGTSEVSGPLRAARDELVIAAAGPLASLGVAFVAAVAHVVIVETAGAGVLATVAALVAVANLALALLNAIPGLPLDGGRLVRAALWAVTGRRDAATTLVTLAGRRFGEGFIAIAVLASAFGFTAIALWAALLGVVLRES
jgi:Zn-dependent protease